QLERPAVPLEPAVADAVGEGEEDGDAAARRPAVREELRVGVEELQRPAAPDDLPAVAVAAESGPDFRAGRARAFFEDDDGAVPPAGRRTLLRQTPECHVFSLPRRP